MSNYDQMLALGQRLFLDWDQAEMIRRYHLESDENHLYLRFLGQRHRIDRKTAAVENLDTQRPAGCCAALSIFDYLCRDNALPGMSGRWRAVNALKHTGQSSPNAAELHQRHAERMQTHIPALKEALQGLTLAPFPQGDAACVFEVFPGFYAVFQFWEGDEEFPPSVRFLWDDNALGYLRFETLFYVMGEFLELLWTKIAEIERKSCPQARQTRRCML